MKVRALIVLVLIASTMWLAGCGHYTCGTTFGASSCDAGGGGLNQGTGGTTKGTYLFIADAGGITGEVLDVSGGKLTANGSVTIQATGNVPGTYLTIAGEKFLYSAYPDIGSIYGFSIGGTGSLTALATVNPFIASSLFNNLPAGMQGMITNPAGTLLFLTDPLGQRVYVYQIGTDGTLSTASNSPIVLPPGFQPYNLAVDGLGKYLYVSNYVGGDSTEVAAYTINSLTAVNGSPFTLGIQQMQGEASGTYMVGVASTLNSGDHNVYLMAIDQASGALLTPPTAKGTSGSPEAVAVQPSAGGTLVYTFPFPGVTSGQVEGFQISSGALTTVAGSPFAVSGDFGQFDQNGKYLFVVEGSQTQTASMSVYDVSASSTLSTAVANVGWADGAWAPTDVQ